MYVYYIHIRLLLQTQREKVNLKAEQVSREGSAGKRGDLHRILVLLADICPYSEGNLYPNNSL